MAKYLLSSDKVSSVHVSLKGVCFTISTHYLKETLFFVKRNYFEDDILSPPMSPNLLEGKVVRMTDLISVFARQLKYCIIRKIISCNIFALENCLQISLGGRCYFCFTNKKIVS